MENDSVDKSNLIEILDKYDCGIIDSNQTMGFYDYKKGDKDNQSLWIKLQYLGYSTDNIILPENQGFVFTVGLNKETFLKHLFRLGVWYNKQTITYIPKGTNLVLDIVSFAPESLQGKNSVGDIIIKNNQSIFKDGFKLNLDIFTIDDVLTKSEKMELPNDDYRINHIINNNIILKEYNYFQSAGNMSKGAMTVVARKGGWTKDF